MKEARVKAYAKINLTLDITGVQSGYHMLDSLVCSLDLCDIVRVKKIKGEGITVSMRGRNCGIIPQEENNAYIAADLFCKRFDVTGIDISIDKNIPHGAGLGGSSADAAATLVALAKIFDITDISALKEIADKCGSDTGYMLHGGFAKISGRGDDVELLGDFPKMDILLCIPKTPVSTPKCYSTYDLLGVRIRPKTDMAVEALKKGDMAELGKNLNNALFPAARVLNEDIAKVFEELLSFAPLGVNMTGSGSCVYALCENDMYARYFASRIRTSCEIIQTKTVNVNNFPEEKNG